VVQSDFDLDESIARAMACQARSPLCSDWSSLEPQFEQAGCQHADSPPRRPLAVNPPPIYSLTALPSLSSLSSLPSLFSLSPLSSIASLTDSEEDVERSDRPQSSATPGANSTPASTLGKRRRRNPQKEAERLAKRQKANPRRRKGSKRERVDKGKARKAVAQAVYSTTEYDGLSKCRSFREAGGFAGQEAPSDKRRKTFGGPRGSLTKEDLSTLEAVRSEGYRIIQWDGM